MLAENPKLFVKMGLKDADNNNTVCKKKNFSFFLFIL